MQFRPPNTVREEPRVSPNAPTLPMGVTWPSFHVAAQFSVNLRLRSRRAFPVIYGTNALVMNVVSGGISAKRIALVEIYCYIACMENI